MLRIAPPAAAAALLASFTVAAVAPSKSEVAAFAREALQRNCVADAPGMAVLLARGDEVLFRGACGMANLELGVALSPDHVFRIGSVTKQFAAAAVLKLVEDGKLSLADPLTKFVPDFPNGDAVTLQMLLDHTSGIRSYTDLPAVMQGTIRNDLDTAQLIDSFRAEPPDFAPGAGWKYNNSGYVLVGAVIESVTGQPWHDFLHQTQFAPLGLAHTGYGDPARGVIPGHVDGYTLRDVHWARADFLSMTQPHAAGALVSTVDDLLRWNRALHGGRLLGEQSYRRMITPVPGAEEPYGLGIVAGTLRGERVLQHGGGIFGFSAYLLYLPDSGISAVALYNADRGRPKMLGVGSMANLLAAFALGKPYPEKTAIDVDAASLGEYEGVYRIDAQSARVLRVREGRLTSQRSGGLVHLLIPVARDTFLFEEGFSRIVFERDAAGRVQAMRFFPEDEGEGERVARSDEPLPAERISVTLPRAALERLVGEYTHEGATLHIALAGDALQAQLAGQPAFEIRAESPQRFFLTAIDSTLEFAPAEGVVETVTLHQGSTTLQFRRAR